MRKGWEVVELELNLVISLHNLIVNLQRKLPIDFRIVLFSSMFHVNFWVCMHMIHFFVAKKDRRSLLNYPVDACGLKVDHDTDTQYSNCSIGIF